MRQDKKTKPGQKPTSAPRAYALEPITGLWIDKQGRAYRLDTHGTHKSTSGEDLPNRLDLVPILSRKTTHNNKNRPRRSLRGEKHNDQAQLRTK